MNAVIYGRRRQGKSTLSLALALSRDKPIIIFDPNCQFGLGIITADLERVSTSIQNSDRITIFRPAAGQMQEQFDALVELLKEWEDYVLVVDETSVVQTRNSINPGLEYLMRQAPDSVDVIQSTHRIYDTQRLVRALATDAFIFRTTLKPDLDVIQAEYSEEVAAEVRKLGIYECLHFWLGPGGEQYWSVWDTPAAWQVPIA